MATTMREMSVEFKVKAAKGEADQTVKFTCVIDTVGQIDQLVEDAMKSQVIKWQAQIRNNWEKFNSEDFTMPEKVDFGQALFGPKVSKREPTKEDIMKYFLMMTEEERLEFVTSGELPDRLFE